MISEDFFFGVGRALFALAALPLFYVAGKMVLRLPLGTVETVLEKTADAIDGFNDRVGRAVSWLALFMVLIQTLVVVQRYVFGVGFIWLQESIIYMHGLLFMLAVGYTLLHGGHVRVDVFYRDASPKRKALTDLLGIYLFLLPLTYLIFDVSYLFVEIAWSVREGSAETSGIQGIYLLKSVILLFAGLLFLQGLSLANRTALILTGARSWALEAEETATSII